MKLFILLIAFAKPVDDVMADAEAMMKRGHKLLLEKKYPEAIQVFEAARALAPDKPGPLLGLGLALSGAEKCREAVPVLERYVSMKGGEAKPEAVSTLAECKVKTAPPPDPIDSLAKHLVGKWSHQGRMLAGATGPGSPETPYGGEVNCRATRTTITCISKGTYAGPVPRTDTTHSSIRWDSSANAYRLVIRNRSGSFDYLGNVEGDRLVAEHVSRDQSLRIRTTWMWSGSSDGMLRMEASQGGAPFRGVQESTLRRLGP
jgi:hypothetical protein